MYCSNCGNELKSDEQYCSHCGTKVGATGNSVHLDISAEKIKKQATQIKSNFAESVADLGKNKGLLFANIALIVCSMIFSLLKTFKVTAVMGISESMSMFDGVDGVRNFFIIGYIVSVFFLLFPLMFKKAWKSIFFLPAKIISILSVLWFLLFTFMGISEVDESDYSALAEFAPSVAGWIYIIATLGALFLSFKLALEYKKLAAVKTEGITEKEEN